jgi:hypothetical protein
MVAVPGTGSAADQADVTTGSAVALLREIARYAQVGGVDDRQRADAGAWPH